jgi:hypothetical protein
MDFNLADALLKVSVSFIDRYSFRESNDTHFEKYCAIPEKHFKKIFDDVFIVHRIDSLNPGHKQYRSQIADNYDTFSARQYFSKVDIFLGSGDLGNTL